MRRLDTATTANDRRTPVRRSAGTIEHRRVQLAWPESTDFRILSIDGGGIRGIFPAAFLAGLEKRYLGGASIADYFDLVAGTSTGGIIALGLGAGLSAMEMSELYIDRGREIFPPIGDHLLGDLRRSMRTLGRLFKARYDRAALMRILREVLGSREFGESRKRLCIPACDGRFNEPYIFKTPHHPDYRRDGCERMTKVGAATSAAPTFYKPLRDGGYLFLDGGVLANNPIMVALVDALSCFRVMPARVRILSLGCGSTRHVVGRLKVTLGGALAWHDIFLAQMALQSHNALGQAGLLIGRHRITRIDAPKTSKNIELDDWTRAVAELPRVAEQALDREGDSVAAAFLEQPVGRYLAVGAQRNDSQSDRQDR